MFGISAGTIRDSFVRQRASSSGISIRLNYALAA